MIALDKNNRLLQGTLEVGVQQIEDQAVDMIFTSPPWWPIISYDLVDTRFPDKTIGKLGCENSPQLYIRHLGAYLNKCWRVLKDDGVAWIVLKDPLVADHLVNVTGELTRIMTHATHAYRWKLLHRIYWGHSWDVQEHTPSATILVFGKQDRLGTWTKSLYAFPEETPPGSNWSAYPAGMVTQAIFDSYPFPLDQSGRVLFDPFCGSGQSLIGAERAGWNWIGLDLDPAGLERCSKTLGVPVDVC